MKTIRENIQGVINPSDLNVGIKGFKETKRGNVVIKCASKHEVERLKKAAEEGLKEEYTVETVKMKHPRVKITGYTGERTAEQLERSIRGQNDWISSEDEFRITYVNKIRQKKTSTIFMECNSRLYFKMMNFKRIFIDWERCPVYEELNVMRCYNCHGYNHKSSSCNKKKACSKCSREHDAADCRSREVACINCTLANGRFGTQYDIKHVATDPQCPSTRYHVEIARSRVDYGS